MKIRPTHHFYLFTALVFFAFGVVCEVNGQGRISSALFTIGCFAGGWAIGSVLEANIPEGEKIK